MPRDGAGVYQKLAASIAVANATILSGDFNLQIDDLVVAANDTLLLSGVKPMSGALAMGTNKITGLGSGTALTDAAALRQVQSAISSHAVSAAGTVDAITLVMSPATTSYTSKETVRWTSAGANTITAPTLNRDAIGPKIIKKNNSVALLVGETGPSGYICEAIYNGTDFLLQNPYPLLASTTEYLTGTDAAKPLTADSAAASWEAGADIATDATITIGEGGYFNLITSVVAITAFTVTTDKAGRTFRVRFNTIRTLTYNATSLILPGLVSITTAVGDIAQFRSLGAGSVVCEWYTRAAGTEMIAVYKLTNETLATSTAYQNDDELFFSMLANKKYIFTGEIFYDTPAAADFKFQWTGPAAPTIVDIASRATAPDTVITSDLTSAFSTSQPVLGASGTRGAVQFTGIIHNAANAGAVNLQWAQNAASGTTTVYAGSRILYRQID